MLPNSIATETTTLRKLYKHNTPSFTLYFIGPRWNILKSGHLQSCDTMFPPANMVSITTKIIVLP